MFRWRLNQLSYLEEREKVVTDLDVISLESELEDSRAPEGGDRTNGSYTATEWLKSLCSRFKIKKIRQ